MKTFPLVSVIAALTFCTASVQGADPVVSNVTFAQRAGTKLVDITYDLTADAPSVTVSLEISSDGGTSFSVPATTVSGAIGNGVAIGTGKVITWDAGADWRGQYSDRMRYKVTANDEFSLIPAGAFTMGDSLDGISDAPTRTVTLSAFFMGQKEVTKAEWDAVKAWAVSHGYTDLAGGNGKAANHPVQNVSWWNVVKWCNARSEKEGLTPCYYKDAAHTVIYKTGTNVPTVNWAATGYRLPTEAEWEKAARGGLSGKRFPWGDIISHTQANYNSSASYSYDISPTRGYHPTYRTGWSPYTSPVGSFAPNGYGLQDMAGNVWEWCWDWYGFYASGAQTDPRGASSGSDRVYRGGSWFHDATAGRAALRGENHPGYSDDFHGFRVARSSVP
ncbi:MAG: SUMF1/EgtB/PvdO family nonheme iron enzyme [Verrucomicrobia bacterium]|nr:SUMF1/EgtB/PvdO family nonheme iron enzyme [Verrucomicrobiota bacterium]